MRLPCGATPRWCVTWASCSRKIWKALSMVHLYCKSAPALTFENLLQDICQEACDAVHRFSKVPSLVTLLHTLRNTLFTTLSLLHSLCYTLFATLSLLHSLYHTLFATLSLLHSLYYTLCTTHSLLHPFTTPQHAVHRFSKVPYWWLCMVKILGHWLFKNLCDVHEVARLNGFTVCMCIDMLYKYNKCICI